MAMAAVMQDEQWRPHPSPTPSLRRLLLLSLLPSLFLPQNNHLFILLLLLFPFDVGPTTPFLRFQRRFLLLVSLSSVMEGLGSVFGEQEYADYGIGRKQMAMSCYHSVSWIFFGNCFGYHRSKKGLHAILHSPPSWGCLEVHEQASKHVDNKYMSGTCLFCLLVLL